MEIRMQDNSALFIAALKRQCPQALEAIGRAAVSHAQQEIISAGRVDTGALLHSIRYEVRGDGVYVGTDDKKAAFHELGTGRYTHVHRGAPYGIKAVHFLHHAASRHTAEYKKLLRNALKGR